MKKTKEELDAIKVEKLKAAIKTRKEAMELIKQSDKLFRSCGVVMCSNTTHGFTGITQVHVFSGIKKFSKLLGEELYKPKDLLGTVCHNQLAFTFDGLEFFELGDAQHISSKYKFR